jgi:hypothetical protein
MNSSSLPPLPPPILPLPPPRHPYLGGREEQFQMKYFAQSRSQGTNGYKTNFKFPDACFQPMAVPSEPDHLSIMKGFGLR